MPSVKVASMSFEEAIALLEQDAVIALYGCYDERGVKRWFHTRNRWLNFHTPYEVIMTVYGYRGNYMSAELETNALERIEEAALKLNQTSPSCDWVLSFE